MYNHTVPKPPDPMRNQRRDGSRPVSFVLRGAPSHALPTPPDPMRAFKKESQGGPRVTNRFGIAPERKQASPPPSNLYAAERVTGSKYNLPDDTVIDEKEKAYIQEEMKDRYKKDSEEAKNVYLELRHNFGSLDAVIQKIFRRRFMTLDSKYALYGRGDRFYDVGKRAIGIVTGLKQDRFALRSQRAAHPVFEYNVEWITNNVYDDTTQFSMLPLKKKT